MSDIALHIGYLMSEHDCVIVPGWGAFIAQYTSAFSFYDSGLYKKPKRFVAFNSSINHSDGLLQNSLMRREGISYEAANREIADFVASLHKQLDYEGLVAIGRLGIFKKNDDVIVFEPYHIANTCDGSFGLADLRIKTLSELTRESVESEAYEEERSNVVRLYGRRFIQVAASIIILIGACFVLSTPLSFDNSTDYAGLESAVMMKPVEPKQALRVDGDLSIALPECAASECVESTVAEFKNEEHPEQPVYNMYEDGGAHYLIVASLDTRRQAEKFIKGHEGDLRILEGNSRYRVYVAQSNSMSRLNQIRRSIVATYPDAWILR
ncbi:MAG: hypothetical protein MR850_02295 [Bacteroidales bacterium]|nr:hypothetical protein [Bacteroidales bacterium]